MNIPIGLQNSKTKLGDYVPETDNILIVSQVIGPRYDINIHLCPNIGI